MNLVDIAFATIPGMILLLAIGIGGDALSRVIKTMATNHHDLGRLTSAAEAARRVFHEKASQLADRNKRLQGIE